MYEWLLYNLEMLDEVPDSEEARREWLPKQYEPRNRGYADRFREEHIETYGEVHGSQIMYAEAFEHCEYGGDLTEENREVLFLFI